jgi:hypothetical protein
MNPAAKTSPKIAVKRIAPIKRIGFKLFIVSTLKTEVSAGEIEFASGLSWWLESEVKSQ